MYFFFTSPKKCLRKMRNADSPGLCVGICKTRVLRETVWQARREHPNSTQCIHILSMLFTVYKQVTMKAVLEPSQTE